MTSTQPSTAFLSPGDPRWEEALDRAPYDYFHTPAYVAACAAHEDGQALLFLADAGDHGMLAPLVRHPLGPFGESFQAFSDARSPYAYPGPVYWGCTVPGRLEALHRAFEQALRDLGVVSVLLRLNPYLEIPEPGLAAVGDVQAHGPLVYLDLRDPEGSWGGINSANRRFIRGQLADGCEVRIDDWSTLDPVVAAYHAAMERLGASSFYYFRREFFLRLREADPAHFHLATAFSAQGEVTGGLFFTEMGGLVHAFLSGVLDRFAHLSPAKLLNNAVRLWGVQQGCHTFNLGGGLGTAQDKLFQFKVRFSNLTRGFATFRKIIIPEVYLALAGTLEPDPSGYFPRYRKSSAQEAHMDHQAV
jgi:hypothetical protein